MTRKEVSKSGTTTAILQKAVERTNDDSNSEAVLLAEGARLKALIKDEAGKQIGRIPKTKRLKR